MRELSFAPFFIVTVFFVNAFLLSLADARNEKAQQVGEDPRTYVIRYKNGDQTIPVTVVLDYKKQTEYVINMNHRTPAKSVTLYDFKQRTIAYKDLTNRECFLGRLTYETLNEETDALNKVQNPVEQKPKILSLDPQQPALTPTEIRNIAGQRTAVFCRKMNTWLIMPHDSHSIQKRETDEVEERTFHRHGYHTVRYSHYGRETRRRFRNSRRNDSRPLLYENKNTSNSSNPKPSISETNSFLDERFPLRQPPYHHQHHFQESPLPSSNSFPQENIPGTYESNPSILSVPDHSSTPGEHGFHPSFGSGPQHGGGLQHKISERTLDQQHLPVTDNQPVNVEHSILGYGRRTPNASENANGVRDHSNAHYVRSPVFTEDTLEPKIYPETIDSSFHNQRNDHSYPPERSIYDFPPTLHRNPSPPPANKRSQIETEWHANETFPQFIPQESFPPLTDDVPKDPDVSTNVLEIPKNGKKFENSEHNRASPVLIPQTNEDVHDLFEGFYSLKDNSSPTNPNYFHNSHFAPPENEANRIDPVHPRTYPTNNFRPAPHSKENDDPAQWNRHVSLRTTTDVTSSTNLPQITTVNYGDAGRVTPPTSLLHSNILTSHRNFDAPNSEGNAPYHEQSINRNGRPRVLSKSNFNPGLQLETSSNASPYNFFTTVSPSALQKHYDTLNHRSDIPSESDHGENARFFPPNSGVGESQNNRSRTSLVPTESVREGVSTQQIRFQNALHNYKPDEIVINVEGIPTPIPPGSIAGFQDRTFVRNDVTKKKPTPSVPLTTEKRSEQTSGGTWRSTYPPSVRNPSRRVNYNVPKQHPGTGTYRQRQPYASHNPVNNLHLRGHTQQARNSQNQPHYAGAFDQPHYSRTYDQQHYPLDVLPPGVSIHPRHPNAPFADMFHSNMPPSLPQESNFRTVKSHRQRHHRKKNRLTNCCRGSGKPNGSPSSSCCRNGGSCCSGHLGKTVPSSASCCQSTKNTRGQFHPSRRNPIAVLNKAQDARTLDDSRNRQVLTINNGNENLVPPQQDQRALGHDRDAKDFSTRQNRMLVPNDSPQPRGTFEDNRERCLKEKMCRTVYESTQQVIVCRNADIVGCS